MNKKMVLSVMAFCGILSSSVYGYSAINLQKCGAKNPYHIIVNKEYGLDASYKPDHMVIPSVKLASPGNIDKNYMEATAAKSLERMFRDAKKQGMNLIAASGYRDYSRQSQLYANAIRKYGANQKSSAPPGTSEHQTGLVMDLNSITESFAYTKEGKWVAKHAHQYGFIVRYPKGKTGSTGYIYEPWHIRYVGEELATKLYLNNLTMEEMAFCCFEEKERSFHLDTSPEIKDYTVIEQNGVSYIKARDLQNLLGGTLKYANKKLYLDINNIKMELEEDSRDILVNGEPKNIDNAPFNRNGTCYLPLRNTVTELGFCLSLENQRISIEKLY